MSLTTLLVPTYTHMLNALSGWLDKAQKQIPAAEAEALLSSRLAPDMYPLSSQVRFACLQAQEATYRLRGQPLPETLEQVAREARTQASNQVQYRMPKPGSVKPFRCWAALDRTRSTPARSRQLRLSLPTAPSST